jgi:5-methylcytosine-specific restriction endonuclease McrA
MTSYIPAALRQLVVERAAGRCEYCRFPQDASFLTFEIDHVISEKHGGATAAENLALACVFCNSFRGTDLGSLDSATGRLTAFFNPRTHA